MTHAPKQVFVAPESSSDGWGKPSLAGADVADAAEYIRADLVAEFVEAAKAFYVRADSILGVDMSIYAGEEREALRAALAALQEPGP
jgi:hypothetical protein